MHTVIPTVMTQSLGIGSWSTRPVIPVSRWRTGLRGGYAVTTRGGACCGRNETAMVRNTDPRSPNDLCTVVDMNGRTRNKFTADSPNQLWCRAIEDRRPYSTGRSWKFMRALARFRMVGSMGPVVSCGDNSAMESFFSLLQKNVLKYRSWITQRAANRDRDVDRTRPASPTPAATPGSSDPDRIRDHHEYASRPGCVSRNCHPTVQ